MSKNFPFATTLDLSPLVDFWREHSKDPKSRWNTFAQAVMEGVEGIPELNGAIDDPTRLGPLGTRVDLLMSAFMSPSEENLVAVASVPWDLEPVYMTEAAERVDLPTRFTEHLEKTYDP